MYMQSDFSSPNRPLLGSEGRNTNPPTDPGRHDSAGRSTTPARGATPAEHGRSTDRGQNSRMRRGHSCDSGRLLRYNSAKSIASQFKDWKSLAGRLSTGGKRLRSGSTGEWYQQSDFSLTYFAAYAFYYTYTAYILIVMCIGAVVLKLTNPAFTAMEAFFMSASCVSQAGLSVVDWTNVPQSTHVASLVLILLGSSSLLTSVPIMFRMNSFRRQRAALTTHGRAQGPYWGKHRESFIRNFGLEYEALKKILTIVLGYWFVVQFSAWIMLSAYFHFVVPGSRNSLWEALYLTVSSFQNNGLTLSSNSVESMAREPFPLTIIMILILLGNTMLPICIYCVALVAHVATQSHDSQPAYDFLLRYPRRCYTHMFPIYNTIWLALMVLLLNVGLTLVMLWQDGPWSDSVNKDSAFASLTTGETIFNAMFQAVSARTAGMNSIDVNKLSIGSTFVMIIWMYIAASPTVVIMRSSAENRNTADRHPASPSDHEVGPLVDRLSLLDITGLDEDDNEDDGAVLKDHARRYFLQHSVGLLVVLFLILCIEKDRLYMEAMQRGQLLSTTQKESHREEVILQDNLLYEDVGFYKILFDLIHALAHMVLVDIRWDTEMLRTASLVRCVLDRSFCCVSPCS